MSVDSIPVILIIKGMDGRNEYRAKLVEDIDHLFTISGTAIKEHIHECFMGVVPVSTRKKAKRVLNADTERSIESDGATEHPMRIIDLRDKGDFVFPNVTHP